MAIVKGVCKRSCVIPVKGLIAKGEIVDFDDVEAPWAKHFNLPKSDKTSASVLNVPVPDGEDDVTYPAHLGGGYFRLSDGSKIKGKDVAEAAELALRSNE
ncbi:MAG: hypothetical protein AB7D47_13180 [Desulfovibrio sp.]